MRSFIVIALTILSIHYTSIAQNSENLLMGIESKIMDARDASFEKDDISPILTIIESLQKMENQGTTHWKEYWTAYALYQKSIFSAFGKSKDEDQGKEDVENAINILKDVGDKNVEDYALLGMMKGFSLQWKSMFAIAKESSIASQWAKTAVELDKNNPRAAYVFGNNDFHTPGIFGGGKKADEYLTKSISLYKESLPNPMMPSWGMEDAYYMLINTKLKADKDDTASELLAEALEKYPTNNRLLSLKKIIEG
jgi:tetratricopeptide (TPR) repeat protein